MGSLRGEGEKGGEKGGGVQLPLIGKEKRPH